MNKLYTKNTWVDEELAGPELLDIKDSADEPIYEDVKIELATTRTQEGTPVTAEYMNNIEEGIDALDDRIIALEIDDLADVDTVGVTDGNILVYDEYTETWIPGEGGGVTDHGALTGLGDDDHTQYILHSLATAANDFLIASGSGAMVKKTLAETLTILGKAVASGLASLDASSKVVQDPANATDTPTASKIPIADGSGLLTAWIAAATDALAGIIELATIAETTTGSAADRAVTPNALRGSAYGRRTWAARILDQDTALSVADGLDTLTVPEEFNGWNIVDFDIALDTASTSGLPQVRLYNVTDSVSVLSTNATCDANEKTSYTAAAPPVIDTSHDDVATGDQLRIDGIAAGTNTAGLTVFITFQKP